MLRRVGIRVDFPSVQIKATQRASSINPERKADAQVCPEPQCQQCQSFIDKFCSEHNLVADRECVYAD